MSRINEAPKSNSPASSSRISKTIRTVKTKGSPSKIQSLFGPALRQKKTSASGNITGYDEFFEDGVILNELGYKIRRVVIFQDIRIIECYAPYGFLCYIIQRATATGQSKINSIKEFLEETQLKSLIHMIGNRASGVMVNRKHDACLLWETKTYYTDFKGPTGIYPVITWNQLVQYPEESLKVMNELYCIQRMEITANRIDFIEYVNETLPDWLDEAIDRITTIKNQINSSIASEDYDPDELRVLQQNREAICEDINQISEALASIEAIISRE